MDAPRVVHNKRERYDVYVGRPSKWGNPFISPRDGTREEVVVKYEEWLFAGKQHDLLDDLYELKGKTLACWCAPKLCHADVLLRLANA